MGSGAVGSLDKVLTKRSYLRWFVHLNSMPNMIPGKVFKVCGTGPG